MEQNGNSLVLLKILLLVVVSINYGESLISLKTSVNEDEQEFSKIGSTLLLLYDVDNVILKHIGPGKTFINPEILPLLAFMDGLHKSKDSRIYLPRIFSHGCGTAAKFIESKSVKPPMMDQSQKSLSDYDLSPFSVSIEGVGEAYLINEVYYLKRYQQENHSPIDILKLFFADKGELEVGTPSLIPFNRILERKSIYFDGISSKLSSQEFTIYRKYIQKAKRSIGGQPFFLDSIQTGVDDSQTKTLIKKIFAKISSLPKVWPYNLRCEELPFVKDLVKYRAYIKDKIQLGTTIVLLDDLVAHFNFACVHEHFTENYKVFIIIIKKFIPNSDLESLSREFQKSIPVPIGTTQFSPFDIREVKTKFSSLLERFSEETSPDIFYKGIRDEFINNSPTHPKCGYDVSKPSPFYFLIVIECDILHNLIKLFIDDRMSEEVTKLLFISSYLAVIPGRKSCEYAFSMVRHLISSGFHQWANKILPLNNIKGSISEDVNDFSPPFSQFQKKNSQNIDLNTQDRHIFMSKFYSRMPRSRTMVLRLDFHGDPSKTQYSDFTCFLNAPSKSDDISSFPSKSTKYRQILNLQSDSNISKFFGVPPYGEMKTIFLLQKLSIMFNKVEGILESTIQSSRGSSSTDSETNISLQALQLDDYVEAGDQKHELEEHPLKIPPTNPQTDPKLATPAPQTIYPQASYSFLSIYYTIVETLKNEFPRDYVFCIGSIN
ncbi:hypothetical protein HWI79_2227 [Cryptosporidium felis]|nr:hypothetical protein HWI79_2227 [Cryptosporidium felis]